MTERVFLQAELRQPAAPPELQAKVITAIKRSLMRQIWIELGLSLVTLIAFMSYLSLIWASLQTELQESPLIPLMRLAWSDPDIIFANLGSSLNGVIESIPLSELLLSLLFLLLVTCTIGFFLRLREARNEFSSQIRRTT